MTTDGPFAETKEALGGFYLVEAKDLDEALAWAAHARAPSAGSIEVRPIVDFDGRPAAPAHDAVGRPPAPTEAAAHEVVDRLFREESGRAVATLIRVLGDFDLAEEAVQDAFAKALEGWPRAGRAAQPGRLDHDDRAERGDRPPPPPAAPRREDRRAASATLETAGGDRRRSGREERDARTASTTGCA